MGTVQLLRDSFVDVEPFQYCNPNFSPRAPLAPRGRTKTKKPVVANRAEEGLCLWWGEVAAEAGGLRAGESLRGLCSFWQWQWQLHLLL